MKNGTVNCFVDKNKFIFDLQQETEEAYRDMLLFIIERLKEGFTKEHVIEFNSQNKTYLKDLEKTDTNAFFVLCAEYETLHPLLRQYYELAYERYKYHRDTDDVEMMVPTGGYAVFSLVMKDLSHADLLSRFMRDHDGAHAIAPRYFAYTFMDRYGWNEEMVPVYCDCILGANEMYGNIESLDTGLLQKLLEHIKANRLNEFKVVKLIEGVWIDEDVFQEDRDGAEGKRAELFEELADLAGL